MGRTLQGNSQQWWLLGLLLLLSSGLWGCTPLPSEVAGTGDRTGCIADYAPEADYFPAKIQVERATGFAVEYGPNYKLVTVKQPWPGAQQEFQYLLVQCGTPVPEGFAGIPVIEIPVRSLAALSTTYLPHLEKLGELEHLVAVDRGASVYQPQVRERLAAGEIAVVGSDRTLDAERLLSLSPELVLTYSLGAAEAESKARLAAAGLPVVLVGDYAEATPLGRAEWLKFVALFFNQEEAATAEFAGIRDRYEELVALTRDRSSRPSVFLGFNYNGTWYAPGGQSYVAQFLADAGADYLWAETDATGSLPLDFESVYARAAEADIWLDGNPNWRDRQDARSEDPRYAEFSAWQRGQLFSHTARLSPGGGNDYWESGAANPDVVLADLTSIFHPDLLSDRELTYYRRLEAR